MLLVLYEFKVKVGIVCILESLHDELSGIFVNVADHHKVIFKLAPLALDLPRGQSPLRWTGGSILRLVGVALLNIFARYVSILDLGTNHSLICLRRGGRPIPHY